MTLQTETYKNYSIKIFNFDDRSPRVIIEKEGYEVWGWEWVYTDPLAKACDFIDNKCLYNDNNSGD